MSYFSSIEDGSFAGGPSCGPGCSCGPCKSGMGGLAEWYEREEASAPKAAVATTRPTPVLRRPNPASPSQVNGWRLGETPTLRHFNCPAPDHAEIEKALNMSILQSAPRAALESALQMAVPWLHHAASKLQVSPREPDVQATFKRAFGTTPEFVPTWRKPNDKWVDRGDLVAMRLRGVARVLTEGWIRFFCWGRPSYCSECPHVPPSYFACSSYRNRYVICLGRKFWENWNQRKTDDNAITLLHEGLHIYFGRLIEHETKTPYGNAYCYERYVLEVNRQNVPGFLNTVCPPKP